MCQIVSSDRQVLLQREALAWSKLIGSPMATWRTVRTGPDLLRTRRSGPSDPRLVHIFAHLHQFAPNTYSGRTGRTEYKMIQSDSVRVSDLVSVQLRKSQKHPVHVHLVSDCRDVLKNHHHSHWSSCAFQQQDRHLLLARPCPSPSIPTPKVVSNCGKPTSDERWHAGRNPRHLIVEMQLKCLEIAMGLTLFKKKLPGSLSFLTRALCHRYTRSMSSCVLYLWL